MQRDTLRTTTWLAVASVVLTLAACADFLREPEQRQEVARIKAAARRDPASLGRPVRDGLPPLHVAISAGYPDFVAWLLDHGADVDARDTDGRPALHLAVLAPGRAGAVLRTLLEHRARLDATDPDGSTALHQAAATNTALTITLLLAAGADPNARARDGSTPLHRAAVAQPFRTELEVTGSIAALVAGGADVDARDQRGSTPLHHAVLVDCAVAVSILLAHGADANAASVDGTPLHVAAVFGRAAVAATLLAGGADPNRRDPRGWTPLYAARHAPAVTTVGTGAAVVDTAAVVTVLERHGGRDEGPPVGEVAPPTRR